VTSVGVRKSGSIIYHSRSSAGKSNTSNGTRHACARGKKGLFKYSVKFISGCLLAALFNQQYNMGNSFRLRGALAEKNVHQFLQLSTCLAGESIFRSDISRANVEISRPAISSLNRVEALVLKGKSLPCQFCVSKTDFSTHVSSRSKVIF
jgi:hypothetical protein